MKIGAQVRVDQLQQVTAWFTPGETEITAGVRAQMDNIEVFINEYAWRCELFDYFLMQLTNRAQTAQGAGFARFCQAGLPSWGEPFPRKLLADLGRRAAAVNSAFFVERNE